MFRALPIRFSTYSVSAIGNTPLDVAGVNALSNASRSLTGLQTDNRPTGVRALPIEISDPSTSSTLR